MVVGRYLGKGADVVGGKRSVACAWPGLRRHAGREHRGPRAAGASAADFLPWVGAVARAKGPERTSRLRKKGVSGEGLLAAAMSLSDACRAVRPPVEGPGNGACDVRSGLAAPAYAASAWGAGVSAVAWPSAPGCRLSPRGNQQGPCGPDLGSSPPSSSTRRPTRLMRIGPDRADGAGAPARVLRHVGVRGAHGPHATCRSPCAHPGMETAFARSSTGTASRSATPASTRKSTSRRCGSPSAHGPGTPAWPPFPCPSERVSPRGPSRSGAWRWRAGPHNLSRAARGSLPPRGGPLRLLMFSEKVRSNWPA